MAFTAIRNTVVTAIAVVAGLGQSNPASAQSIFNVSTFSDSGAGSLREAITAANSSPDRSTINFTIDRAVWGNGPWTITLASELPAMTAPVIIRGFSQPGASASTAPLSHQVMIEIDDSAIPLGIHNHGGLLTFIRGAEGSVVSGLSLFGGRSVSSGLGNDSAALLLMANNVRASANRIGVRANGALAAYAGVPIAAIIADSITVGGAEPADGNWIGAADSHAIQLTGGKHVVRHNLIGFDRFGASSLANTINGAGILAARIGYSPPPNLQTMYSGAVQNGFWGLRDSVIADNRISATRDTAIALYGTNNPTSGNRIDRNVLGRDFWGSSSAHVYAGIRLSSAASDNSVTDNLVGNANAGIILGNASGATVTRAGNGNRLSRNLFFDVAHRGIGLDPDQMFAPLANDPQDVDSGPNALQNKPQITAASTGRGLEGRLDAAPSQAHTIEFFLSSSCHPNGFDRAEFFLDSLQVTTDTSGRAVFSTRINNAPLGGLRSGDVITATATDSANNTSELSACFPIAAAASPTLKVSPLQSPEFAMKLATIKATIQSAGPRQPSGEIVFMLATATATRELARAAIVNGQATISGPPTGFLPHAGHYEVYADYAGDGFHMAARSPVQALTVFRPPSALLSSEFSSPLRRDLANGDREYYEAPMNTWRRLTNGSGDTFVDADRFAGSLNDNIFLNKSGQYRMVEGNGTVSMLHSGQISMTTELLDLVHVDGDVQVDAIVRDPQSAKFGVVQCAFRIDNCERFQLLDVSVEFAYLLSGDFNGDGNADLVFRNPSSGEVTVILMLDGKALDRYTLRLPSNELPVASADLNGDGYEDLVALDAASGKVTVHLMQTGRPFDKVGAILPSAGWETPGAIHIAKLGESDFGIAHLVFRDTATGEVVVWRKPKIAAGQLSATPQSLYFDPALEVERTR